MPPKRRKLEVASKESQESISEDGPSEEKSSNLKITSWNVNGLRAWSAKGTLDFILLDDPDILCLQETKCDVKKIPATMERLNMYHRYWSDPTSKKGYAGVALYSKRKPLKVTYGIGIAEHDQEGRVITSEYDDFYLINAYVPNSGRGLVRLEYRMRWEKDFRAYMAELSETKPIILTGDLNVSHQEIDLANPSSNHKTAGFTDQEREAFTQLLKAGYVDSFRFLYPKKVQYTFWSTITKARDRNIGWRLDYFVVSESLMDKVVDSIIRDQIMGSDHCPITLLMAI